MAITFFRTDGTAVNLAAATGPATNAAACGDKTLLEASSFAAGDIVNISTLGGSFSDLTLDGANLNGSSGSPVILRGDSVYNTTAANEKILELSGSPTDIEWVDLEDFWAECTHVAAQTSSAIQFFGDVGIADNASVNISGCKSRNLGGDGFSQLSGGRGHVNYTGSDAVDCGSGRALNESNQGFTAHAAEHTAELTNTNATGCNEAITFVGGAAADWISGTISGSLNKSVKADSAGAVTLRSGVTLNNDVSTCSVFDIGSVGSSIILDETEVNITEHNSTDTFIRGLLDVTGGTWTVDSSNATIHAVVTGTIDVSEIVLNAVDWNSLFRSDGNANCTVRVKRNSLDFSSAVSTQPVIRMSGSSAFEVEANVITDTTGISDIIDVISGSTVTNMSIRNNTVFNTAFGGKFLDDDAGVELTGNIFVNVEDVDRGSVGAVADFNCYFNSEDLGGASSITTDPLLSDPSGGDFTLQSGSPAIGAGKTLPGGTLDKAGNLYKDPPSMGAFELITGIALIGPLTSSLTSSLTGPLTSSSTGETTTTRLFATFDGTDDFISIPSVTAAGDFVVEFQWSSTSATSQAIIGDDLNIDWLRINDTGSVTIKAAGQSTSQSTTGLVSFDGKLQTHRVERVGTTITWYLENILIFTSPKVFSGDATFDRIGQKDGLNDANGVIANVDFTSGWVSSDGAVNPSYPIDDPDNVARNSNAVLGSELVTDGWDDVSANVTVSDTTVLFAAVDTSFIYAREPLIITAGETYIVELVVDNYVSGNVNISMIGGVSENIATTVLESAIFTFTATESNTTMQVARNGGTTTVMDITLSIREALGYGAYENFETDFSDRELMTLQGNGDWLGAELVTNGTFDTDTDWTLDADWDITGGTANLSTVTQFENIQQTGTGVLGGGVYATEYDVLNYVDGEVVIKLGAGGGGTGSGREADGTYSQTIENTGASDRIEFFSSDTGSANLSIDNASVKRILEAP